MHISQVLQARPLGSASGWRVPVSALQVRTRLGRQGNQRDGGAWAQEISPFCPSCAGPRLSQRGGHHAAGWLASCSAERGSGRRQASAAATATAEGGGQLPAACSTGSAAQWSMIDLYKQHERLPGAKQAGERATLTSQPKPSQLCPLSF